MTLDTRQLRYFVEIADQGSITGAARTLGVAQPALSQHLRKLEQQLGAPLMLRQRSGVVPTEAGLLLIERARHILGEMSRTVDDIRTLNSDPSGVVRIGLPGTISAMLSLPLITTARTRYPNITLNIAEAMSGFIGTWLMEDRVDLSILYHDLGVPGFKSNLLLEEELVILWPAGSHQPDQLPLSALAHTPMVLPSRGHGLRELIERRFLAEDTKVAVAIEIDSYANIKSLVANGFGPSILPAHAVRSERQAGTLETSRIAGQGLMRMGYLVMPTSRPVTRAQTVMAELMQQVVVDLIRSNTWAGAKVLC